MRDPRSQVPRRIDRIARGTTERKPDSPDKATHQKRPEAGGWATGRYMPGKDCKSYKHQNKGGDHFAQEVGGIVANRRTRAEYPEFCSLIWRFLPMRKVVQPDKHSARNGSEDFRRGERRELRKVSALDGKGQRHRRIEKGPRAATG